MSFIYIYICVYIQFKLPLIETVCFIFVTSPVALGTMQIYCPSSSSFAVGISNVEPF